MKRLESQLTSISSRLYKICQEHKISERHGQLYDENFCDWDAENQEAMVNMLHNADMELDRITYLIGKLCSTQH
jgi:hypothetical protein